MPTVVRIDIMVQQDHDDRDDPLRQDLAPAALSALPL